MDALVCRPLDVFALASLPVILLFIRISVYVVKANESGCEKTEKRKFLMKSASSGD